MAYSIVFDHRFYIYGIGGEVSIAKAWYEVQG